MTVTASLVQTLHRINRQKSDLNSQLARGPKVVASAKTRWQAAQGGVQRIIDEITAMRIDVDDKQLQMKEREDKIHHWKGQLNAAKENREYQALKDQIAADTQANVVLSDEILEILERLDEMAEEQKKAEANAAEVLAEYEAIEKQVLDKKGVLEKELARVEAELSEAGEGADRRFQA